MAHKSLLVSLVDEAVAPRASSEVEKKTVVLVADGRSLDRCSLHLISSLDENRKTDNRSAEASGDHATTATRGDYGKVLEVTLEPHKQRTQTYNEIRHCRPVECR